MQNVLLRLREVQPSLSSTERQIAQFILENPDETTTLTIRDLARRSFSSPSSVVRICRVIGFQGYKELRHALTLELATLGENGSHREKDINPQDSPHEIVDKVTHKNIQSLLDTQRLLLLDELEQCVELVESCVNSGHKLLLFSQFTSMLDIVAARLDGMGIRYFMLTGSTKPAQRLKMVNSFNGDDTSVFLISLKAGGTGLNLTGADVVIHYDPWWNVAAQNQATDRAYRIGQQNPVQVYKLIAQDTIEEKIVALQQAKQSLAETVTGSADGAILSMKPEELLELLEVPEE